MSAPPEIDGFRHHREDDRPCNCGCAQTEGRRGTLVQDSDTPKLIELGMAIYEFPADRHPQADFPRAAVRCCFHLADLSPDPEAVRG